MKNKIIQSVSSSDVIALIISFLSRRSWWEYAKVESKVIKSKYIYVIFFGTLIRSPSKSLSVMQKSLFYFFIGLSWSYFLFPCLKNISGLFEVFALSGYLSWQANRFWALQVCRESENPLFTKLFLRVWDIKYVCLFDYAFSSSYWVFSGLFKHFILSKFITQISADFPSTSAQTNAKTSSDCVWTCLWDKIRIFCEVWTLPTSRHSLSPTEHFIPAAWIFPLCPSGHVLSLISSTTTLKYSCNAYRIRTFTHNTCESVYSTMQTGSWDGWVLQNGKVWACFRKIWFHCWNTGAHLLQNDCMCIQRYLFFTFEYV